MLDMHCHILPGVDDGSRDLDESLAMFAAAKKAGVTEIICTPHCRDPYFDYDAMCDAYDLFCSKVAEIDPHFPIRMGFEVNWEKLVDLGVQQWAPVLGLDGPSVSGTGKASFLLELSTGTPSSEYPAYYQTVFELQGMGYDVIIAHPERYIAIQHNMQLAQQFIDMGCTLQASCDFIDGGRLGREKKPAKKMLKAGMYTFIASDAHRIEHYDALARAEKKYGNYLRSV